MLYILQTFFSIFLIYILFFILFFQSSFSFHIINLFSYMFFIQLTYSLHIPFISIPSFSIPTFSHLWSFLLTSSILMLSPSNILSLPIFFSFQLINLLFTYMFFIYSLPSSPPPSFLNIKLNSLFLIFSSFTHIIFPLLPTSLFHFHEIPSRLTWTIPPFYAIFHPFSSIPLTLRHRFPPPSRFHASLHFSSFSPSYLFSAYFFVHQRVSPFSRTSSPNLTLHPLHNISTSLSR